MPEINLLDTQVLKEKTIESLDKLVEFSTMPPEDREELERIGTIMIAEWAKLPTLDGYEAKHCQMTIRHAKAALANIPSIRAIEAENAFYLAMKDVFLSTLKIAIAL